MRPISRKILLRLGAAALSAALLSGCSLLSFETPEQQLAAAEAARQKRLEVEEDIEITALQSGELSLERTLENSAGCLLATYSVRLPQFSRSGQKSESFTRINGYFENEFSGLQEACEGFFADVRQLLGEGWNELSELSPEDVSFISVDYALAEAPAGYVSVRCDYTLAENRQKDSWSQGVVFLLDNGWELSLETLLGSDYDTAAPLLLQGIWDWCGENGVTVSSPERFSLSDFSQGYLLTADSLIFYTQPFQLSNEDGSRYAVALPLSDYAQYLNS